MTRKSANGRTARSPKYLQIMAKSPLFKGLSFDVLTYIFDQAQFSNISSQSYIFHQFENAEYVYVILEGQVCLFQTTPSGKQVIMEMFNAGDNMAITSVFTGATYPLTAQAVTDCLILSWPNYVIENMMRQHAQIAINAFQFTAECFLALQNRYRELATERVEQRIARVLLRLAEKHGRLTKAGITLKLPNSRQTIAEMVGTTLYTVSRTCGHWEELGLIKPGREQLTILNPDSLANLAQDSL